MHNQTILISGAGIAGPTLAFWLNAAGFVPTLIERSPELRSGGYVIDFWGLGYDIAERMGLKQDIDRIGYHVREMRIVGNQGNRIAKFPTRIFEDFTEGRYVTLARSGLSRLLFEKVQDTTEVIFNDEIIGIEERTDRVQVRLKHQGERRFDLVVGADGLHSAVRRLAFGPQDQFELSLGYAVAAFEVRGYKPRDEDVYLMYGQPGLMVGRFTLHDNRTLFLFVFTADSKRLPDTTGLQKRLLRERYDTGMWECRAILDALDCTHELYLERVSQIKMENWSRGRIALVGDAAFCVSLLAGQGSALAMIRHTFWLPNLPKATDSIERHSAITNSCSAATLSKSRKEPRNLLRPLYQKHTGVCGSATKSLKPSSSRALPDIQSVTRSPITCDYPMPIGRLTSQTQDPSARRRATKRLPQAPLPSQWLDTESS
jgi:2-polyprenyl-6-methoxyphenol hydroxylase-like FAD-dependent oxidoreductase